MRKILVTYLPASLLLAFLAMILVTCGGGGDGSDPGTTHPPAKSVVITGTVPGTVAIAYDLATGKEAARDVADGTPKKFLLSLDPGAYYLMFIENEGTASQRSFAFRNVTGGNVFTFKANTTLDLGVLDFKNYKYLGSATPQIDPISGNHNVTESSMPEATFSPGAGGWTATKTFVNSTCPGHSPGTTVTENVTIAQGFGLVTYTPAGSTDTAGGVANVNTAILTDSSGSALVTIYLTMQPDGSLEGTYSRVGYGGGCSEEATITAVLGTSPPPTDITPTIPFTQEELSGKVFFEEGTDFLYILNADSTLNLYAEFGTPPYDPSYYVTGTWSNDPDGLDLDYRFADYAGSIVQRVADSLTGMEVKVFEKGWEFTRNSTWEKTMSVDPAKLPGTYRGSDGYTWVFNNDGTGTCTGFGGITFTWSVDSDGVLMMPGSTGYTAVFYARATSQSTATGYTILKVGFAEHNTSTGYFYKYYGGLSLTRQ